MTVTPEIERVAFLRRRSNSLLFSLALRLAIISEFEGILSSWYLAATCILALLTSLPVGEGMHISVSTSSLRAFSAFKFAATTLDLHAVIEIDCARVSESIYL